MRGLGRLFGSRNPILGQGVGTNNLGDVPEVRPAQMEVILAPIQAVSQPDAPNDVQVCTDTGHNMPK